MTSLISRLEAATEQSRELDYEIGLSTGYLKEADWPTKREKAESGDKTVYVTYFNKDADAEWHGAIGACCPLYTSSIDAAVALAERVLPEWGYVAQDCGTPKALVVKDDDIHYGSGATPAIALCIAILKAKEASRD